MPGTIVYLNGPSSCGKHAVIAAFQDLAPEAWVNIGVHVWFARMGKAQPGSSPFVFDKQGRLFRILMSDASGRQLFLDLYTQAASLAEQGTNVIVDDSMHEPWMITECALTLAPYPAYFVGVRCRLGVSESREMLRTDRPCGLAAYHFHRVHRDALYDVSINTTDATPEECAARIKARLDRGHPPHALAHR